MVLQIVARYFSLQSCSKFVDINLSVMKRVIYSAVLGMVVFAGLFVGIVKGQEVRHKWLARMKNRHEAKNAEIIPEVSLDEIEMATYHS